WSCTGAPARCASTSRTPTSCGSSTPPVRSPSRASPACWSPSPSTPTSRRGGRRAMCWAGSTPSATRPGTCCSRSRGIPCPTRRPPASPPTSPTDSPCSGCWTRSSPPTPPTARPSPCGPTAHPHPSTMAHLHILLTGQWAVLTLDAVAGLAAGWGYDGLEIAGSGEHLDASRWDDDEYIAERLGILEKHGLKCWTISNHLKGQAICDDPIDFRHEAIVRSAVWGDGDPEGVRQRAAEDMKNTARLARKRGVSTVVGFTGSKIWKYVAMFPPVPESVIDEGYQDFAERWNPILDVFDESGVRFAHEVHPSEIAYDYWTTQRTLEAIGHREAFGLNWDPSHF